MSIGEDEHAFRAVEHGAERGYPRRLAMLVVLRDARNIEEEVPVVEGVAKEEDGQEDEGSRELAPLAARRQCVVGWMHGGAAVQVSRSQVSFKTPS